MSNQDSESSDTESDDSETGREKTNNRRNKRLQNENGSTEKKESIFTSFLSSLFEAHPFLKSIDGRAATVHNFMRGLSLYKAYPFSPFTSFDDRSREVEDKLQGKELSPFVK